MSAERGGTVNGSVEIDAGWFGGYVKPSNHVENRRDLRRAENQNGKRQAVIIMRSRNGKTLPFIAKSEADADPTIRSHIEIGSTVYVQRQFRCPANDD